MIKGVTKSVIEMTPRNSCFEKIIIILNSGTEADMQEIQREAEQLTSKAPDYLKRQRNRSVLQLWIAGVTGALVTAGLFYLAYVFV